MNIQQALSNITKNIHLTQDQMQDVMRAIMSGEATDAQIGALLMGLRLKGESIDEITAAARVMRELPLKLMSVTFLIWSISSAQAVTVKTCLTFLLPLHS